MHRTVLATLVALCILVPNAQARFVTGQNLLRFCESKAPSDKAICLGFVDGVIDTIDVLRSIQGAPSCFPSRVEPRQAIDVIVRWLKANPDDQRYAAAGLTINAVADAWPCPGAGQGGRGSE